MRIISFSKRWDKFQQTEFTTFRYPRGDKDWYVGEEVQVYFKNRSPQRERLGVAKIIGKEQRELDPFFAVGVSLITDAEVIADGFSNLRAMIDYMEKTYGLDYISCFNKLTLRWVK